MKLKKLSRVQHRGSEMGNITERLRSTEDKIKRPHLYLTEIPEAKNGQKQYLKRWLRLFQNWSKTPTYRFKQPNETQAGKTNRNSHQVSHSETAKHQRKTEHLHINQRRKTNYHQGTNLLNWELISQ